MNNFNPKTISFILRLLYPKCHPVWILIYMLSKYYLISKRRIKYKISILPDEAFERAGIIDLDNCALVHPKNVYFSDHLLILANKGRYVKVARSTTCRKDTLYVSNTLMHNIKDLCKARLLKPQKQKIKFAQEIDISLVAGPYDLSNAAIDSVIKSYFKHEKLIQVNDLISINIKHFCPELFYTDLKLNTIKKLYFKCNKVNYSYDKGQFFCVIGTTAIKQSANVQMSIPKVLKMLTEDASEWREVDLCPYGLRDCLDEVSLAMKPFIESKNLKNLKPAFLIQGEEGWGEHLLLKALAAKTGMHHFAISNAEIMANVYAQSESKMNSCFFAAKMCAPCIVSIHKFENIGQNAEGQYDPRLTDSFTNYLNVLFDKNPHPVILFCCTKSKNIPANLKRLFLEIFNVDAPTDRQRADNLKWIMELKNLSCDVSCFEYVANKTHGFYFTDLEALVCHASYRAGKVERVREEHFDEALEMMQSNYNESLGAPKVPKVQWSDVGGLTDVKEEIIKTINLPLKHPEFFKNSGLARSGILLFGPPGTGKTLIAKAVATECSFCFLTVKGPELLNMYVGQSEQNVREVFERARQASPCIVFFDELDSLAPNRGLSGDSGGVMDRVVSQLLAEMDGLDSTGQVFIIGATNRPDLIDPALLRPGRFDKLLFVGPCTDAESKVSVLRALTRKFKLAPGVDLQKIVSGCPKNVTGADFYGICSGAWSVAAKRLIEDIEKGGLDPQKYSCNDIQVRTEDFLKAIKNVKPSISEKDLKYFDNLKRELSSNSVKL